MNATLSATASLMSPAAGSGLHESVPFVDKCPDMFESFWQSPTFSSRPRLGSCLSPARCSPMCFRRCPSSASCSPSLGWIVTVAAPVLAVTVFAAVHVKRGDSNRLANMPHGWAGCSCLG